MVRGEGGYSFNVRDNVLNRSDEYGAGLMSARGLATPFEATVIPLVGSSFGYR